MATIDFQTATYKELHEITGIHKNMWCDYVKNGQTLKERTLVKAALALGMTVDELLSNLNYRRKYGKTTNRSAPKPQKSRSRLICSNPPNPVNLGEKRSRGRPKGSRNKPKDS